MRLVSIDQSQTHAQQRDRQQQLRTGQLGANRGVGANALLILFPVAMDGMQGRGAARHARAAHDERAGQNAKTK